MAKKTVLRRVFEPGKIGSVPIRNRIVRMGHQPLANPGDNPDGSISPRLAQYHAAAAKGGAGIVTVAHGNVELAPPKNGFWTLGTDSDYYIPSLKAVSDAIHEHGAAAFFQIFSPYPRFQAHDPEEQSLASSDLSQKDLNGLVPAYRPTRGITKEEIQEFIEKYVELCIRLQKAGYDGVEINGAHNHFHNTFLSPAWNRRTDEYGGDAKGRTRFLCEIIKAIKHACGEDFAIINLINVLEFNLENGIKVEDAIEHAKELEGAGSDAIHCRMEIYDDAVEDITVRTSHEVPDTELYPRYVNEDLSEYGIDTSFGKGVAAWSLGAGEIKKNVSIPVICVGRMDAYVAEKLIEMGRVDFVNVCRRFIADHDYARKIEAGKHDEVRPCIGCFTCYDTSERGVQSECMVNAAFLGGDDYATIKPTQSKRRVLVVGSGAAGLEFARVAALRGHEVTIAEKEQALGGTLPLAAMIKDFHEDFLGFSEWQVRQIEGLGVKVLLKTTVDRAFVDELKPDVVVVAVGGRENTPDIPGIDKKIVTTGEDLHKQLKAYTKVFKTKTLGALSKIYLPLGNSIIVMGGAMHGVQTARFLRARGRHVIIVEESDEFGSGMYDTTVKPNLLTWLKESGVEFHKSVCYKEITDEGLVIADEKGSTRLLAADSVITTLPMLANLALYEQLEDAAPEVYAIGDCNPLVRTEPYPELIVQPVDTKRVWPAYTVTAVREAYRIAREL